MSARGDSRWSLRSARPGAVLAGAAALALALALPREWYDTMAKPPGSADFPVDGVTLLRGVLLVDAAVLLAAGLAGWRYRRLDTARLDALARCVPAAGPDWVRRDTVVAVLLLAVALALRLHRLGTDLWIDEITTLALAQRDVLDLLTRYTSPNNHLLNTLLIKVGIGAFGAQEWAIRLPAALAGAATVPAMYWVARRVLAWQGAALSALLLAVSYHHVFFSQNARGYATLLLFSLAATGFLLQAVQRDRLRDWALYVASLFLAFAALINAAHVYAAHGLVALVLVVRCAGGGGPWRVLAARLVAVLAAVPLLVAHLYAVMVPQMAAVVADVYSQASSGFATVSREFVVEVVRGLAAGFGPGFLLGALPLLAAGAAGLAVVARRDWALTLLLVLPTVVTAAHLATRGLTVSPRFFLFGIFVALIAATAAVWAGAGWAARRLGGGPRVGARLASVLCAAGIAVSAAALPRYYAVPKQSYRAAIEHLLAGAAPGGPVLIVRPADVGILFYAERTGAAARLDLRRIRDAQAFAEALDAIGPGEVRVVTTLERLGRLDFPDIYARLDREWRPVQAFPASLGGGELVIWQRKEARR